MTYKVDVVYCGDCKYFHANNAEEGDWSGVCERPYSTMENMSVDGASWFCPDGDEAED